MIICLLDAVAKSKNHGEGEGVAGIGSHLQQGLRILGAFTLQSTEILLVPLHKVSENLLSLGTCMYNINDVIIQYLEFSIV